MRRESEFIKQIKDQLSLDKIGDDCAVLPKNDTHDTLITSDLIVEDIDFRRNWMIPEFLGHKALTVSLSDIAAMGGKPLYSMLSIGIPKEIWQTNFVDEFYEGYLKLAKLCDVELIGGDVSRTPDKIVVDSTVIGEVQKDKAILRSGAKVGDLIYVTGELGGASAGLQLLENGSDIENSKGWRSTLIAKQLRPVPRLLRCPEEFASPSLNSNQLFFVNSMIDISDGLSSDLMRICEQSQTGAKIFAEKIPLHSHLSQITKIFSEQLEFALEGGEDFELLFTVDPKNIFANNFAEFFCIGVVTANVEILELIDNNESKILQRKGYEHF